TFQTLATISARISSAITAPLVTPSPIVAQPPVPDVRNPAAAGGRGVIQSRLANPRRPNPHRVGRARRRHNQATFYHSRVVSVIRRGPTGQRSPAGRSLARSAPPTPASAPPPDPGGGALAPGGPPPGSRPRSARRVHAAATPRGVIPARPFPVRRS